MSKTRIMLLTLQTDRSGVPRYLEAVVEACSKDKFTFFIAAPSAKGIVGDIVESKSSAFIFLGNIKNNFSILNFFVTFFSIKKIVNEYRPDIVHLNGTLLGFVGSILMGRSKNLKLVYTFHGVPWGKGRSIFKNNLFKAVERISLSFAKNRLNIVLSEFDISKIEKWLPNMQYVKINNPLVELGDLHNGDIEEKRGKEIRLLCVAKNRRQKRLPLAIKAFGELSPGCKIKFVGEGVEVLAQAPEYIELEVEKQKNISLVGEVSNVNEYYREADIFLVVSDYEGFSMAMIEALAYGCQVVSTRVGGSAEAQENFDAIICDNSSFQEIVAAINIAISRVRVRKERNSQAERARAYFSIEKFQSQMLKVYSD